MSKTIFDSAQIDVPCPQCAHPIPASVGALRTSPQMTCPNCSGSFKIDASKFDKAMGEAQKATENFKRQLSDAFKR